MSERSSDEMVASRQPPVRGWNVAAKTVGTDARKPPPHCRAIAPSTTDNSCSAVRLEVRSEDEFLWAFVRDQSA